MAGAGHCHHPGGVGGEQGREQAGGERPVPEVVHPELQLESVVSAEFGGGHHAGVVDQDVDGLVARRDGRGGDPHRVERRQVEGDQLG
jgi:hypothetical protein